MEKDNSVVGEEDDVQEKAPTRNRFSRRREKTRNQLMEAARQVFAARGLAEATIKEIADGADVGFGTFYLYFTSKEDIFDAVLRQGLDELRQVVSLNRVTQPGEFGKNLVAYFQFAYTNRDLFKLVFWNMGESRSAVRQVREDLRMLLADRLEELIQARIINWPDPALLASLIIGVMSQAALWWVDHDSPDPEEMAGLVGGFLLHGLTPGEEFQFPRFSQS